MSSCHHQGQDQHKCTNQCNQLPLFPLLQILLPTTLSFFISSATSRLEWVDDLMVVVVENPTIDAGTGTLQVLSKMVIIKGRLEML